MYKFSPRAFLLPAFAAAMLSTAALAHEPGQEGGWHHHGHHHGAGMMLKQLDLSDAQKAQVKTLFHNSREQMHGQFAAVRSQRQAFEAATPGTAAYQSAAASLAQAESAAAGARVQQEAELRSQVYALLTDAQKAQLSTLQAQREARRAAWREKHAQAPSPN